MVWTFVLMGLKACHKVAKEEEEEEEVGWRVLCN